MGVPGTIAAYLIPHKHGVILVECGPGSTILELQKALKIHGYSLNDVSDVLLTHIHLDHAGAAGALSKLGARIFVHHVGAHHLRNPEKLLDSAKRIYGDMMDPMWGEMLAAEPDRVIPLHDGDTVEFDDICFQAIDTPGHANHHLAYKYENVCFSGDIGGVRLPGLRHLRLPIPPPELHLGKWRQSIDRLRQENIKYLAPTHYGIYNDPEWHLECVSRKLNQIEEWITRVMQNLPSLEMLDSQFQQRMLEQSKQDDLKPDQIEAYETVNPSWMSSLGLERYWQKHKDQD
jgi:glyoxylase-like metal-dependent hydrolase (beta-lactamase superfamily II)